jgi:hypothetical protein
MALRRRQQLAWSGVGSAGTVRSSCLSGVGAHTKPEEEEYVCESRICIITVAEEVAGNDLVVAACSTPIAKNGNVNCQTRDGKTNGSRTE